MPFNALYNLPTENNSFEAKGIRTLLPSIPYAAAIALPIPVRRAFMHMLDFALLTGALTLNATDVSQYQEGDEMYLSFVADGTGRTITWGSNIRAAAATLALTASQVGLAHAKFINSKWTIVAQVASAA